MIINSIESIGTIHTPHKSIENMPIQPKGAVGIEGYVAVDKQYEQGLKDLNGFSHIYLVYFFHKAIRTELQVKPFMDTQTRGVFATRSPLRPNHIGISIVRLKHIDNNRLMVSDIDILDNTPLLDIKPYVECFDRINVSQSGWLTASEREIQEKRSDCRFK